MTKDEALTQLNELGADWRKSDNATDHVRADEILCEFLRSIGHGDISDAYEAAAERVAFWYE